MTPAVSESLYGLDKPDELKDLKLKLENADQEEIIEETYKEYMNLVKDLLDEPFFDQFDNHVYKQASRVVRPFAGAFKGSFSTKELPYLTKYEGLERVHNERFFGVYLSALLNETNMKKLSIGRIEERKKSQFRYDKYYISYVGYQLQPGKILEILKDGSVELAGKEAKGGVIVNYGRMNTTGHLAKDGLFINHGISHHPLGHKSHGGIYINHNKADRLGDKTEGGIYFNFGKAERIGTCDSKGIFVSKEKLFSNFTETSNKQSYVIGCWRLFWDEPLRLMVNEIEAASKENRFDDIKKLARKIDKHVRKNYKPRKVA